MPRSAIVGFLLITLGMLCACGSRPLVEPTTPEGEVPGAPSEPASGVLIFSTVGETGEFTTWRLDLAQERAEPQIMIPGFLAVSMAPEGARFAGIMSGGSLWAFTGPGGADLTPLPEGYFNAVFQSESRFVVCNRVDSGVVRRSELRLVDLAGEQDTILYQTTEGIWDDVPPAFSPDGSMVTFYRYGEPAGMYALSLETREATLLVSGALIQWSPDGRRFLTVTRDDVRRTLLYRFADGAAREEREVSSGPAIGRWLDDERLLLLRARERGVGDAFLLDLASGGERPVARDVHFGEVAYRGWAVVRGGSLYYFGASTGEGISLRKVSLEGDPDSSVALATGLGVEALLLGVI
jgi:dipeptidyl aminopeptidase/acylaminoacyl peptidase